MKSNEERCNNATNKTKTNKQTKKNAPNVALGLGRSRGLGPAPVAIVRLASALSLKRELSRLVNAPRHPGRLRPLLLLLLSVALVVVALQRLAAVHGRVLGHKGPRLADHGLLLAAFVDGGPALGPACARCVPVLKVGSVRRLRPEGQAGTVVVAGADR